MSKAESDAEDTAATGSAGTAEFKTVRAACGIRFDPDTLDEEAGFDFSGARQLREAFEEPLDPAEHNPDGNSDS